MAMLLEYLVFYKQGEMVASYPRKYGALGATEDERIADARRQFERDRSVPEGSTVTEIRPA